MWMFLMYGLPTKSKSQHQNADSRWVVRNDSGWGRYLDVYECRDGEQWKFAKRKIVMDWNQINPVEEGADQQLLEGITQGQASAADPSYSILQLLARHSQ